MKTMRVQREATCGAALGVALLALAAGSVAEAQSWAVNADGDWGTAANWSPASVPNGVDAPAVLAPVITAPRTITLDVPVTLGALAVQGGQTYTLSGPNALTFDVSSGSAGLSRLGNGGLLLEADVVLNDLLDLSVAGTGFVQTFGDVSGAGGIEKRGTGTLFLRSATSYTGGTLVSEGTLAVAPSALQGDVVNNATLDFRLPTNTTFGGVISGTGAVLKTGAGALTLTGVNTYAGGTTISDGRLVAGASALPGNVVNSATLEFAQTGAGTFAGEISGSGDVVKSGAGALTLTGSNTYTGGTTISAGRLIAGPAALPGNVVNNATLEFAQSSSGSYAGVISGSGNVFKTGAGSLTLTGLNTYAGTTTISEGSVFGSTASLPGPIVNNATLIFAQSVDGAFANVISGTGAVIKAGAGTLTLTSANTYTGTTTVEVGRLIVEASALNGDVVNNATLEFDQSSNDLYSGVVSGSGDVVKSGTGSLQLAGANTYTGTTTVSGGALFGTTASLPGAITNNGRVFFAQSFDGIFSDVISGTGEVVKAGTGTVTFSAAQSYTGKTTVGSGTLNLEGSVAGDLDLLANGRLAGNGSVGGAVTVVAGGTLAPGNSIGTLSFGSLSTAGVYEVEYRAPGVGAPLVASGSGQSLRGRNVALDAGLAPADQDADLILVSGAAMLSPSAAVVLRPLGTDASFNDAFATAGNTNRELRYLILRADGGVTGTFVALSDSGTTLEYLSAGGSAEDVWLVLRGPDTPVITGSAPAPFLLPVGLPQPRCDLEIGAGRSCAVVGGAYASQDLDSDGALPGTEFDGGSGLLGFAYGISDELQVGIAYVRETGDLSLTDGSGSGDLSRQGGVLWGEWQTGGLDLRGWLGVSFDEIDTSRATAVGGTAQASVDARQTSLAIEGRRWMDMGQGLAVTPLVGLAAHRLDQDGYSETGGGAEDFTAGDTTRDSFRTSLGVEVRKAAAIRQTPFEWSAAAAWEHEFADTGTGLSGTYAGDATGTVLTSASPDEARDRLNLSLGATVGIAENAALRLGYDFSGSNDWTDHGASLRLSMRF
jgi:autotransporter-associated beta strand protein